MVDSVECGTYIEQGQEGDLRFIYCSIDIREEAEKEGLGRVALTKSRLINWEKIIYVQVMGWLGGNNLLNNFRQKTNVSYWPKIQWYSYIKSLCLKYRNKN